MRQGRIRAASPRQSFAPYGVESCSAHFVSSRMRQSRIRAASPRQSFAPYGVESCSAHFV